jgi:hypothetical protein
MLWSVNLFQSNHQLESRMREIRLSGSEGGAKLFLSSLPLSKMSESHVEKLQSLKCGGNPIPDPI